jgi:hypothetical protein
VNRLHYGLPVFYDEAVRPSSRLEALAYRSRHRHSPNLFVAASKVKRWFYDAIPDPKRRIRQRAVEILRAGMEIEDVAQLMRIPISSLQRWLRESTG